MEIYLISSIAVRQSKTTNNRDTCDLCNQHLARFDDRKVRLCSNKTAFSFTLLRLVECTVEAPSDNFPSGVLLVSTAGSGATALVSKGV
jgi:hypothetical protein